MDQPLFVGQHVRFMPSVSSNVRTLLPAVIAKVWTASCVDVEVSYPADGKRKETSVLVCRKGQLPPTGGYFVQLD